MAAYRSINPPTMYILNKGNIVPNVEKKKKKKFKLNKNILNI